ncbi:uncharacterized protein [Hetaerina americana]|uniref:uncharacterized protein isoform X2 n=1 Tax=Hetaerina americana TaxID=62018 RepID=UPI003A7F5921
MNTSFLILLLMVAFTVGQSDDTQNSEMTYQIKTTWDDRPLDHDPVAVTLVGRGKEGVEIKVDAPFFGVPGNPGGEVGKPFDKLWEYEVVEVFFADGDPDKPKYVEVELCPWGQHLVLLLDGVKNSVRKLLPIVFTASINGNRWNGSAIIPAKYFPPKVTRFNGYAIHDVTSIEGDPRRYEALFPVPRGKYENADFHRLDYFKPLNFELLQPGNNDASISDAWPSSLAKASSPTTTLVTVTGTIGGLEPSRSHANLTLEGRSEGENTWLSLKLSAIYMNAGAPPLGGSSDDPLTDVNLDSYETVRAYLANEERKVLELVFSPYGPYDVKLYSAPYNLISRGHRLNVTISTPDPAIWSAAVDIPLAYLPANFKLANVASVYQLGDEITYEAAYMVTNAAIALPDLFVIQKYTPVSIFKKGINDAYSDLWDVDN